MNKQFGGRLDEDIDMVFPSAPTCYCLGFAFSKDKKYVLLIHKNRPEWQRGCLNGIGGHVEVTDKSHIEAQSREFQEETGLLITEWQLFAVMHSKKFRCSCFVAFVDKLVHAESKTDELVALYPLAALPWHQCISNLRWLIPLALDLGEGGLLEVEALYS